MNIDNGRYTWRREVASMFKGANAQKCAEEIFEIGDQIDPKQIVDKASDESTELHRCFEWDDEKAAEKYRLTQARTVLRCLVFVPNEDEAGQKQQLSIAYRTVDSTSYETTRFIFKNEDSHAKLLKTALSELRRFEEKYSFLTELGPIFKAIDSTGQKCIA